MPTNALIIVAHGSRKASSNTEVMRLGENVKPLVDAHYDVVKTAFLEFAQPSLEESIIHCVKQGVSHVVVLPYFLASGNHVTLDIPAIVAKMTLIYPEVNLELKQHLGSAPGMATLLSSMAH